MTTPNNTEKIKEIQTLIGTPADGQFGEKSINALRTALQKGVVIPITANITLNELLASQTATRHNIDNMPNHTVLCNLIESSVNLWQVARDILGKPIRITSGYRCPELNARIGGAKNSAHKSGFAIDFSCPDFGSTRQVVAYLQKEFKARGVAYDQLILEYPQSPNSWVHLGYKNVIKAQAQRGSSFTIA